MNDRLRNATVTERLQQYHDLKAVKIKAFHVKVFHLILCVGLIDIDWIINMIIDGTGRTVKKRVDGEP